MFEIYSIGDGAFLADMLNGVAMVFGYSSYSTLVGIGILLGVIMVAFQAMGEGKGIPFEKFLVAFVLFSCFFVPKTSVMVNDVNTGTSRVVDNVPFGIGVGGWILSTASVNLTEMFEAGFSTPSMAEGGYNVALKRLLNLRYATFGPASQFSSNENDDLQRSIRNYIRDCTLTGVDRGEVSEEKLQTTKNIAEAMRWDSQVYMTEVFLNGSEHGETVTCTKGYEQIVAALNSVSFRDKFANHLAGLIGPDPFGNLEDAANALMQTSIDGRAAALNAVMAKVYEDAVRDKYISEGSVAATMVLESGAQQRQVQWAAEQNMFLRVMKPMITFFEALVFAISPFMAFLIATGPMGIKLAGKYVLMLIWVQLWMPVMAIVNAYINFGARGKFDALSVGTWEASKWAPESIRVMADVYSTTSDWLATGGMLAAAVPSITLMLIYGSAITATSLAGRMQGGDHIAEKTVSPDMVQLGAVGNVDSHFKSNPFEGNTVSGSTGNMPKITSGSGFQAAQSSARQEVAQAQEAYNDTLSSGISEALAKGESWFDGISHNASTNASRSSVDSFIHGVAKQLNSNAQWSNGKLASLGMALQLAGQAGTGGDIGASVSAALSGSGQFNENEIASYSDTITKMVQGDKSFLASFQRAVSEDAQHGRQNTLTESLSKESKEALSHSESRLRSASDTYSRLNTESSSFGIDQSMTLAAAAERVAGDQGLSDKLSALTTQYGLANRAEHLAAQMGVYGISGDQADEAAQLALLLGMQDNGMTGDRQIAAAADTLDLLRGAGGSVSNFDVGGAGANAGIAGDVAADIGNVPSRSEIQAPRAFDDAGAQTHRAHVEGRTASAAASNQDLVSKSATQHNIDSINTVAKAEQPHKEMVGDERARAIAAGIVEKTGAGATAMAALETEMELQQAAGNFINQLGHGLVWSGLDFYNGFREGASEGDNIVEQFQNGLRGGIAQSRQSVAEVRDMFFHEYRQEALEAGLTEPLANLYAAAKQQHFDALLPDDLAGMLDPSGNFDAFRAAAERELAGHNNAPVDGELVNAIISVAQNSDNRVLMDQLVQYQDARADSSNPLASQPDKAVRLIDTT